MIQYSDWQLEALRETELEVKNQDRILNSLTYKTFVSKSKGKGRKRRNWKEIELVSYQGNGFKQWHRFPFDEVATEILPCWEEWRAIDEIQDRIRSCWG